LLRALWRRIDTCRAIDLIAPPAASSGCNRAPGRRLPIRATQIVDARGRTAATTGRHLRPPQPWLATTCTVTRSGIPGGLRLAAAPNGYGYRLGSAQHLTIGWVAPGRPPRTTGDLRAALSARDTHWLLDGVELVGPLTIRVASLGLRPPPAAIGGSEVHVGPFVATAEPITIGDAALRRDALASQGLSIGLSDARLTARTDWTAAAGADRTNDSTRRHIRSLLDVLATSRYRHRLAWRSYAAWIGSLAVAGA
jgi:hypothetical protein